MTLLLWVEFPWLRKPWAPALVALALALLTWLWFPGHTWLQQDTQIYAPILEHLRDPAVLRNDLLVAQPHVSFTLYDEAARFLRALTLSDFQTVLALQQILTRALGIWGLYLMALALGLSAGPAALVAAICSLGASILGPAVLTFEYEPTPRAFAVPLLFCAIGLAAHHRYRAAALAAAAAFLYHPPTALSFWALFLVLLAIRRKPAAAGYLAAAAVVLALAALAQGGESQTFFSRLTPLQEQLQRLRAPYVWISDWPPGLILHYLLLTCILIAACVRVRHKLPPDLRIFILGLPALGLLSMPLSWLLLEHWKWGLIPQVQPLRALLFLVLVAQFLTAAAGVLALGRRNWIEAFAWFALAYQFSLHPQITAPLAIRQAAVIAVLAALTAGAARFAPVVALAAFLAIPMLSGVINYPGLHTPELRQLSDWARVSTPPDAVFLFADAGRGLQPGIFRSEALRAVYVDWKAGGQVNYLTDFGEQWWFRWQQTLAKGFRPTELPKYSGLGIAYIVLQPAHRLPRPALFENANYSVYPVP